MKVDPDTHQRVRVFFLFLLEAYKVAMGSFLCIFVPHGCNNEKDCSILDTLRPQDGYETVTLTANGVTFAAICLLYVIELRRENFFIRYFDIDHDVPDTNLGTVITPELKTRLLTWNNLYWKAAATSTALVGSNIALSSVYLARHYRDTSTITTILSFSILVLMKLWRSFSMARHDRKMTFARSAYMTEYTSFNTLDPDMTTFELEL